MAILFDIQLNLPSEFTSFEEVRPVAPCSEIMDGVQLEWLGRPLTYAMNGPI